MDSLTPVEGAGLKAPFLSRIQRGAAVAFAAAALAGTLAAPGAVAQTLGTEGGRALAQEYCARCHAVSAAQERPGETDAPPFRRLAADRRWTQATLMRMMTVPHANMPPPVLTNAEAQEVAAYILSLW
jgi:mono/diheme cytochrome c family protein